MRYSIVLLVLICISIHVQGQGEGCALYAQNMEKGKRFVKEQKLDSALRAFQIAIIAVDECKLSNDKRATLNESINDIFAKIDSQRLSEERARRAAEEKGLLAQMMLDSLIQIRAKLDSSIQELVASVNEKKEAVKNAQLAMQTAEAATKRADRLSAANQNVISAININFTDPTLALRFAERNFLEFPESPVAASKFFELLIDEKNGKATQSLDIGRGEDVEFTSFSANGISILVLSKDMLGKRSVKLWNNQGELLGSIPEDSAHTRPITAIALSPDGKWALTGSEDKTVNLWKIEDKRFKLFQQYRHDKMVSTVAFSATGDSLVTAARDMKIILWKNTGEKVKEFYDSRDVLTSRLMNPKICALALSHDGNYLLSGLNDGSIAGWSLKQNRTSPVQRYRGLNQAITQLTISNDGQNILAGSFDKKAVLWNRNGEVRKVFLDYRKNVTSVAITPTNDKVLIGYDDHQVKVWDISEGKERLALIGHLSPISSIFTNGHDVITADTKGMIKEWELHGLKEENSFELHKKTLSIVNISSGGSRLWTGAGDSLKCWEVDTSELEIIRPAVFNQKFESPISAIASTNDTAYIGLQNGDLIIWDLKKNTGLKPLNGHRGYITAIVISPDKKHILTASRDNTAILWDKEGSPLDTFPHGDFVNAVAFSPTGERLITGSKDGTAKIWSRHGMLLKELACGQQAIYTVACSPNGKLLFTGTDSNGRLWDVNVEKLSEDSTQNSSQKYDYVEIQADFNPMAFFPNGEWILGSSEKGIASIWDLRGFKLTDYTHDNVEIKQMGFLPQGQGFYTASGKKIKFWISPFHYLENFVESYSDKELAGKSFKTIPSE